MPIFNGADLVLRCVVKHIGSTLHSPSCIVRKSFHIGLLGLVEEVTGIK